MALANSGSTVFIYPSDASVQIGGALQAGGAAIFGSVTAQSTTQSTSVGTGSIVTAGGLGVAKAATFGGTVDRVPRWLNARSSGADVPNTTFVTVVWDFIDVNTTGLVQLTGGSAGVWQNTTGRTMTLNISYQICWQAYSGYSRLTQILKMDTDSYGYSCVAVGAAANFQTLHTASCILSLAQGEYFIVRLYQDTATTLTHGRGAAAGVQAGYTTRIQMSVV